MVGARGYLKVFKRKHDELQSDINSIDSELAKMETGRKFDVDLLEEVFALSRNIPKTYKEAPQFLKKRYLNFFFEKIMVDNKNIVDTVYSPLVQELINQQSVILRKNLLPNSSIKLYQLFPSDLLEQMRIKLEILHDLLGSKSQYATVEAKNGRFCRFDL